MKYYLDTSKEYFNNNSESRLEFINKKDFYFQKFQNLLIIVLTIPKRFFYFVPATQ